MSKKYERKETLGHGGMANVYRAWDVSLKRDVAIKELSEEFAESERFVHLFLSEGHKMASINHPNVLQIYDSDDDGQQPPRLVMELAESTLADQIGTTASEPVLVERVGRQVLQGLEAIHKKDLVHRDIKPANIFYSGDGIYKIGDFGIATDGEEHTQLLATPKYMAPEVLSRPHLVGPASDLYSLGLILYEALVGSARFEEVVTRVVDAETAAVAPPPPPGARKQLWRMFHGSGGDLPAPHTLDSEIPKSLSRWISKLTRKNISERFGSCREALATLDRGTSAGTEQIYGAEVTQPVEPEPKKRLGGLQIGLLAALAVMLLGAGIFLYGLYNRPTVEITSEPEGAAIYFEGKEVGQTPMTERMRVGATVELRLEGFEAAEATLEDRKAPLLHVPLKWRPVMIRSEPEGARLIADGEERGLTPFAFVGQGTQMQVSLEREGYETESFEVEPGHEPPVKVLKPRLPVLPQAEAAASPDRLADALRGFLTAGSDNRLAVDGSDDSRVRFGQLIRLRAEVRETAHAALFLLFSTGDAVVLYPSRRAGALRLEAGETAVLPRPVDARSGYRLEASEPAGRDLAFLLTSRDPLPEPPTGQPLGRWATQFAFAGGDRSPALALVRWAAGVRHAEPQGTELVMTEILVEAGS